MGEDDESLRRFQERMRRIPLEVRRAVLPALVKGAEEIAADARRLAPEDDGDLVRSIRVEPGPNELSVVVRAGGELTTKPVRDGADASYDYAMAQEFGTAKMPANPFFWPAYRLNKKRVRARIARAIRKAIKEAWK